MKSINFRISYQVEELIRWKFHMGGWEFYAEGSRTTQALRATLFWSRGACWVPIILVITPLLLYLYPLFILLCPYYPMLLFLCPIESPYCYFCGFILLLLGRLGYIVTPYTPIYRKEVSSFESSKNFSLM